MICWLTSPTVGWRDRLYAGYGPKRIVRDLLNMPGLVSLAGDQVRIDLLSRNQFAEEMVTCLIEVLFGLTQAIRNRLCLRMGIE